MIPVGTQVMVSCAGGNFAGVVSAHGPNDGYLIKFAEPTVCDELYEYGPEDLTVVEPEYSI